MIKILKNEESISDISVVCHYSSGKFKLSGIFNMLMFFSFLLFVYPRKIVRYTDIDMEDFKCPIFLGCIICVTGLRGLDRKAVQQLTVKHGGQYMGQLKMNECTHLIVQEPKGKTVSQMNKCNIFYYLTF